MPFQIDTLDRYPTGCGVYIMKNSEGRVLYVGKAINLKSRLKQYFSLADERAMIPLLISQVETIETIIVETEKEALLLENNLIKLHWPKYNACLKDDKTYFSLAINHKHPWPMVRVVRYKGRPPPSQLYFGPYAHGHAARETLELIRRLFPLRQCSDQELVRRKRPCILYDLKRCLAPCTQRCSKEEYDIQVKRVIDFLRGHDESIINELRAEMELASDHLEFEKANRILKTLRFIETTLEKQKIERVGRKDLDAVGLFRHGETVVIVELFFREGKLMGASEHLFTESAQDDDELLSSFLLQNYSGKEFYPNEILLPLPLKEEDLLSLLLTEEAGHPLILSSPKRGDRAKLIEMATKNAEAKFYQEKSKEEIKEQLLIALEEELHLTNYPERIECFDNSNIGGTEMVSAMVVYIDGEKKKDEWRLYKLRETKEGDDYGALREVLFRRFRSAKIEGRLPDLIVIDGGKGHLHTASDVLLSLDIRTVDLIAISKEAHKHTKGITLEKIHHPNLDEPIQLKPHSPLLLFLQQVRDEAHRFAITFQKKRRLKKSFSSQLNQIPGIGPVKRKRLLKTFGSLKRILSATDKELLAVEGLSKKDLENLRKLSV